MASGVAAAAALVVTEPERFPLFLTHIPSLLEQEELVHLGVVLKTTTQTAAVQVRLELNQPEAVRRATSRMPALVAMAPMADQVVALLPFSLALLALEALGILRQHHHHRAIMEVTLERHLLAAVVAAVLQALDQIIQAGRVATEGQELAAASPEALLLAQQEEKVETAPATQAVQALPPTPATAAEEETATPAVTTQVAATAAPAS